MIATRRGLIVGAGALALLSACQKNAGGSAVAGGGEDASDMALGDPNAKVTLIEYASVTCSHCRAFHTDVWPKLRATYIDTNKIKFIFREFPTPPQEIAVAGFQIARCAADTPAKYFSVIDTLFDQQPQVFDALQKGTVKDELLTIAKSAGLSEDRFTQCVSDEAGMARVNATVDKGVKVMKVEGTPTFFLNGERLPPEAQEYDKLAKMIDAKIAAAH